ncbi:MAG: EVE domain-containing protein [Candidatus Dormiibacterota bacterium]
MGNDHQREDSSDGRRRRRQSRHRAQYRMVDITLDNFRRTQDHGFNLLGVRSRHRRRAEVMRPGDRVLFYVTSRRAFAATATLTSGMLEDRSPVWQSPRRDEEHPWRFRMRSDRTPDEGGWIPARDLAYRLEYVRKWPPEMWALAFQGHIHQLPQKDFKLIEVEMSRTVQEASEPA